MKNRLRPWELALLMALGITFCAGFWAERTQRGLSDEMIRLHVVANSDSPADQAAKLDMRDRVLEVLNPAIKSPDPTPASLVSALSGAAHAFAGQAPQSDDLTLLVVQFAPGEVLRERITLVNEMDEVERLNAFVKAFLGALHLEGKMANGLRLALEESVVNVINYAYAPGERGEVTVLADSDRKQLRFTVIDSGKLSCSWLGLS